MVQHTYVVERQGWKKKWGVQKKSTRLVFSKKSDDSKQHIYMTERRREKVRGKKRGKI